MVAATLCVLAGCIGDIRDGDAEPADGTDGNATPPHRVRPPWIIPSELTDGGDAMLDGGDEDAGEPDAGVAMIIVKPDAGAPRVIEHHGEVVAPARDVRELRVMAFNIALGNARWGPRFAEHVDGIAALLDETDVDVVALQEVDYHNPRWGDPRAWVDELSRRTRDLKSWVWSENEGASDYGVAILSRWDFDGVQRVPLPRLADEEPRQALAVTVRAAAGAFRFVSTHLDTHDARPVQAAYVGSTFAHEALPTVLGGDFNSAPTDAWMPTAMEGWIDTALAVDDAAVPTKGQRRIDYLFVRGRELEVVDAYVRSDAELSDHRPLVAVLRLDTDSP